MTQARWMQRGMVYFTVAAASVVALWGLPVEWRLIGLALAALPLVVTRAPAGEAMPMAVSFLLAIGIAAGLGVGQ